MHKNEILKSAINDFFSQISKAENIIIISHENPDGDSVGSALGLYYYLTHKNKSVKIYFPNNIPETYKFLSGTDKIKIYQDSDRNELEDSDLLIVADVNSPNRIGKIGEYINNISIPVILIDHHINPQINSAVSIIDTKASATGELIYQILKEDESFKFDFKTAEALYTAILTDTGGFRHDSTTAASHLITADLMNYGINTNEIFSNIYNQISFNVLRILGRAYLSSKLYLSGKLNIMYVTSEDMEEFQVYPEDLNNFSETTLTVSGTLAGVFISRHKSQDYYKLSFRSRGDTDIRSVALLYGGGGHFNAAGGREYNLNLDDLIIDLVEKISKLF